MPTIVHSALMKKFCPHDTTIDCMILTKLLTYYMQHYMPEISLSVFGFHYVYLSKKTDFFFHFVEKYMTVISHIPVISSIFLYDEIYTS